jgi:hypothetical protein
MRIAATASQSVAQGSVVYSSNTSPGLCVTQRSTSFRPPLATPSVMKVRRLS